MGNAWKVVVAFVGVFVAGTVFGSFFALGVGQRFIEARRPPPPTADPMLLQRYVQLLDLTEEQKTKIKPILDKAQTDVKERTRQANIETAAVILPIVQKAEGELKKFLNAEQIAKLTEIQKNPFRSQQLDIQGSRGRGGPPGGGGFSGGNRGGGGGRGDPNFNPNRGDGQPGGQNGQGGGRNGQRGPGGQGFPPGGVRSGGPSGQSAPDPKAAPANPAAPTAPAPAGN